MTTHSRKDPAMDIHTLIEQCWPYDGPHSADTVGDAAEAMALLTRYINNASRYGTRTLPYAPHTYLVLGSINAVVHGLDQLLDQLATTLRHLADDPSLYDDYRWRPGAGTACAAADRLMLARAEAARLAHQLLAAHELTSHLGHDTSGRAE